MNTKSWMLASLVVFVVITVSGFIVDKMLLKDLYQQTASIWRPDAQIKQMAPFLWVGAAIYSLMFTFIYAKGYEKKKVKFEQGFRYGIYVALLTSVPVSLGLYTILPVPGMLAIYWAVVGLLYSAVAGVAVAYVYKA